MRAGADANRARTEDGQTPVYGAAWCGYGEVVKALVEAGVDVNQVSESEPAPRSWISTQFVC